MENIYAQRFSFFSPLVFNPRSFQSPHSSSQMLSCHLPMCSSPNDMVAGNVFQACWKTILPLETVDRNSFLLFPASRGCQLSLAALLYGHITPISPSIFTLPSPLSVSLLFSICLLLLSDLPCVFLRSARVIRSEVYPDNPGDFFTSRSLV